METIAIKTPFETKEAFLNYRKAFKELAHQKALNAHDMMMHNILRGRDPAYGFSTITKQSKIDGGMRSKHIDLYGSIWSQMRRWKQHGDKYAPYVPCAITPAGWQVVYDRLEALHKKA